MQLLLPSLNDMGAVQLAYCTAVNAENIDNEVARDMLCLSLIVVNHLDTFLEPEMRTSMF